MVKKKVREGGEARRCMFIRKEGERKKFFTQNMNIYPWCVGLFAEYPGEDAGPGGRGQARQIGPDIRKALGR